MEGTAAQSSEEPDRGEEASAAARSETREEADPHPERSAGPSSAAAEVDRVGPDSSAFACAAVK